MEFIIKSEDFKSIINDLNGIVEKNPIMPIGENVIIKTKDSNDTIFISGSRSLIAIEIQKKADIIERGKGLFPIIKLKAMINLLGKEDVRITIVDGEYITITQNKLKYKIAVLSTEDYIEAEFDTQEKGDTILLTAEQIREIFSVESAAYTGEYKPSMSCIDIETKGGKIYSMATDSRLLQYNICAIKNDVIRGRILVPLTISNYMTRVKEDMYLRQIDSKLIFRTDNGTILQIDGVEAQPLPYQKLLSAEKNNIINIDKAEFNKALKRLETMSEQMYPSVVMKVMDRILNISIDEAVTKGVEEIDIIEMIGEGIDVRMNIQYLLKGLSFIRENDLEIRYKIPEDNRWEGVLFGSGGKDQIALIMPINDK